MERKNHLEANGASLEVDSSGKAGKTFSLIISQFDTSQFVNEIRFSSNPSGYSNQFFPHHSNANKNSHPISLQI